ncbi:zinc-ribbon domain containing protein [Agarivorans sp. 1_MG-2023]
MDYNFPPDSYSDTRFTCVDCGINKTWAAQQQKFHQAKL